MSHQRDFHRGKVFGIFVFILLILTLMAGYMIVINMVSLMNVTGSVYGSDIKSTGYLFPEKKDSLKGQLVFIPYEIGSKIIDNFNKDTKTIFTISYQGKNYEFIYRESIIPFASRYELRSDDGPVTDPDTAVKILRLAAWNDQEVLSRISSLDVRELNRIKYDAEKINYITSPIYSAVHPLKINFDKTKKISVMGYSLFDALTKDYKVRYFYRAIESLDEETGKWSYRTTGVINAVNRVVYDIQLVNSGSKVNPEDFEKDFTSASSALSSYQRGFDSIAGDMNELLEKSNYVKSLIIRKFPKAKFLISPVERMENVVSNYRDDVEKYSFNIGAYKAKIDGILSVEKEKEKLYYRNYITQFYSPSFFGIILILIGLLSGYIFLFYFIFRK